MEVSPKPFARRTPDQLVYLELGSGNGGMLLSISEEGFRFRAVSPLHPNGLIPFAFSFDGAHRLAGVGEIEWLDEDGRSGGMRFADVSSEFRAVLDQWLASPSRQARSGRKATPGASIPPDSMEKIREDLRRGYAHPAQSLDTPPPSEPPCEQDEPAGSGVTEEETAPQRRATSEAPRPKVKPEFQVAASGEARGIPRNVPPPRKSVPEPPLRPHFSQPAEDPPGLSAQASAIGANAQREAPVPPPVEDALPPPLATAAKASAVTVPLPQFSAGGTLFAAPVRPHIPAIDDSFDAAWEHARLTAPVEPPHLNRAAASSIIGLALAVIAGAFAYNFHQEIGLAVIQIGQRISGQAAPAAAVPEAGAARDTGDAGAPAKATGDSPAPAQEAQAPANGSNASEQEPDAKPAASAESSKRAAAPAPKPSTARNSGTAEAESSTTSRPPEPAHLPATAEPQSQLEPGNGQGEFAEARELLRGVHRKQDLSRAVDLLWAGVRKGYVPAEVTLADLYRRGDGVERNCDQAQVLLVAASKKGSPDARRMLEQLAEQGCE